MGGGGDKGLSCRTPKTWEGAGLSTLVVEPLIWEGEGIRALVVGPLDLGGKGRGTKNHSGCTT